MDNEPDSQDSEESPVRCFKCGNRVTASASTCIHCGAKLKRGYTASLPGLGSRAALIGGGVGLLLTLVGLVVYLTRSPAPPASPPPAPLSAADFADPAATEPAPGTAADVAATDDFNNEFSLTEAAADEPEAVRQLRVSASEGDAGSAFRLGQVYYNGEDVEADKKKALAWFKQAALTGHPEALLWAGRMLLRADGVEKSAEEGLRFAQQSAEQGNSEAQFLLAQSYLNGESVASNLTTAVEWLTKAAEKNHAEALSQLGLMALNGQGMEPSMERGVVYLRRAADMGRPEGLEQLKEIVRAQVTEEVQAKFAPFQKGDALVLRQSNGQVIRGSLYRTTTNTVVVLQEGHQRVDIPLGDIDISNRIRLDESFRDLWIRGRVEEDLSTQSNEALRPFDATSLKTLEDWTEAAWRGFREAQRTVGLAHLNGRGTPVDFSSAFVWLRIAALQGDSMAQYHLGLMYFQGRGVPPNESTSLGWLARSAEQGNPNARQFLDKFRAARANYQQLLDEEVTRRKDEMDYHAKRLEEIRNRPDYNRLGMRQRSK